jgi:hypothetical protein
MSNLSDKELDRLSREAAEHYQPDEDISSWDKLEQILNREITDKPPGSAPGVRTRPIIYGSLVLLLGGISYFLIKPLTHTKHSTLQTQSVTKANKQAETAEKNSSSQTDKSQLQKNENEPAVSDNATVHSNQPAAEANTEAVKGENKSEKIGKPANHENANNDLTKDATDKKNIEGGAGEKLPGHDVASAESSRGVSADNSLSKENTNLQRQSNSKNKNNKTKAIAGAGIAAGIASTDNGLSSNGAANASSKHATIDNSSENQMKSAVLPGLVLSDASVGDVNDGSLRKLGSKTNSSVDSAMAPKQSQQALHIRKPLKIGVMFAPDYTNVGSASNNQFSSNIGITLGYEFENRWSVNTGIIYTAKNYAANGKDFKVEWVITPNNYHLDFVNGSCYMIEIPLSLRYDFSVTRKTKFFVNGGLSSYLMKNQAYTFHYHYYSYNPPGTSSGSAYKTYPGDQNYWLGIASFSAGMERELGKNFSLQVEPFIKVPLSGVGIGNLQLNSYGLSFSLRYSPVLSRSRH